MPLGVLWWPCSLLFVVPCICIYCSIYNDDYIQAGLAHVDCNVVHYIEGTDI